MSAPEMILIGCAVAIGLAAITFWVMMIHDCATKMPPRSRERWVWLVIVVLGKLAGALAYYLLVKRPAGSEAAA
jgi:hypothetical protein